MSPAAPEGLQGRHSRSNDQIDISAELIPKEYLKSEERKNSISIIARSSLMSTAEPAVVSMTSTTSLFFKGHVECPDNPEK